MSWAKMASGGSPGNTGGAGGGGGNQKSHSVAFQVPKTFHYHLIGSRGVVVKGIEQKCSVRLVIPRREDSSTTVRVSGSDRAVGKAQKEMEGILGFKISTDPLVVSKFDIPSDFYGKMIGPRAVTINGFQKKHGCSIIVPRQGSKESLVSVQGGKGNVVNVQQEYQQFLGIQFREVGGTGDDAKEDDLKFKIDPENEDIAQILFFPDKDGTDGWDFDRFLEFLSCGHKTLDICVFTITHDMIAETILREWDEGVKVRIITDNDQAGALGSDIIKFKEAGIPVKQDTTEAHMHHKFCVIDGLLIMNGSFNWTRSASTNNQENCMVTNDKRFVEQFSKHFEEMWADGENFVDY